METNITSGRPFAKKYQKTALALAMAGGIFSSSPVMADATLLNGQILTPTAELFATEGPMWDIGLATQQITVVGKTLTIADTIDGAQLLISGSSVLGQDGEAATGISAASFDRLSDRNAIGRDVTEERCGAARSIFSTSEARRTDAPPDLDRDPVAQAQIEANYFAMVRAAYPDHAGALPTDFLQRAGVDRPDGNGGLMDVYPVTAGGTLKSAGHVYTDGAGNEHLITDIETVIELSENVSGGPISSASRGVPAQLGVDGQCIPGFIPPSFVIGDMLVIFNQDPRFGADVLGLGEAEIPREVFFDQVDANPGVVIDTIGHLVGEHVMFVQEVLTEFTNPNAGIVITADRFRFRDDRGEVRFRGTVDKPTGIELFAVLTDGINVIAEFGIPLLVDPITGGATYSARARGIDNLASVTEVTVEARNGAGEVEASETFPRE